MATQFSTAGDNFYHPEALKARRPASGYTAVVGDLISRDTTVANGVLRADSDVGNAIGIVVSTNGGNGTLSIAELEVHNSTIALEYVGTAPTVGQLMEPLTTPAKGTVTITDRDAVQLDNTNGNLKVLSVNTTTKVVVVERVYKAGAGTVEVA